MNTLNTHTLTTQQAISAAEDHARSFGLRVPVCIDATRALEHIHLCFGIDFLDSAFHWMHAVRRTHLPLKYLGDEGGWRTYLVKRETKRRVLAYTFPLPGDS